jgi:hypothetical protein
MMVGEEAAGLETAGWEVVEGGIGCRWNCEGFFL